LRSGPLRVAGASGWQKNWCLTGMVSQIAIFIRQVVLALPSRLAMPFFLFFMLCRHTASLPSKAGTVRVLLCFIKPILGNRDGPGVSLSKWCVIIGKHGSARPEGTRNGPWTRRHTHTHVDTKMRNRTKHLAHIHRLFFSYRNELVGGMQSRNKPIYLK